MAQKRDKLGRFVTNNPKIIVMRVTEEEKELILRFRQIQNPEFKEKENFTQKLVELIQSRINYLEFKK